MSIYVPTSLGELVDKITILTIKNKMLSDDDKLLYVRSELNLLSDILEDTGIDVPETLYQKLHSINLSLWKLEDDIREKEKRLDFGEDFIEMARSIYQTNDARSFIKKQITDLDKNSIVQEQKGYV